MDVDMSLINDIEDEEIIDPDLAIDEVIVDSTTEINERMKREIFTEGSSFLIIYEEGDEFIDKLLIVNDLNIEQDKILLKDEEQNDENLYFDTDDTLIMKNEFYTINDIEQVEEFVDPIDNVELKVIKEIYPEVEILVEEVKDKKYSLIEKKESLITELISLYKAYDNELLIYQITDIVDHIIKMYQTSDDSVKDGSDTLQFVKNMILGKPYSLPKWLIPIIQNRKRLYKNKDEEIVESEDVFIRNFEEELMEKHKLISEIEDNDYKKVINIIHSYNPFENFKDGLNISYEGLYFRDCQKTSPCNGIQGQLSFDMNKTRNEYIMSINKDDKSSFETVIPKEQLTLLGFYALPHTFLDISFTEGTLSLHELYFLSDFKYSYKSLKDRMDTVIPHIIHKDSVNEGEDLKENIHSYSLENANITMDELSNVFKNNLPGYKNILNSIPEQIQKVIYNYSDLRRAYLCYDINYPFLDKENRKFVNELIQTNIKEYIRNYNKSVKRKVVQKMKRKKAILSTKERILLSKDFIMGLHVIPVRNNYLKRFMDTFSREPTIDEDSNYLYEKNSTDKLLCKHHLYEVLSHKDPEAFSTLKSVYGGEVSDGILSCKVCKEYICHEDFSTLEGFSDGAPTTTKEVLDTSKSDIQQLTEKQIEIKKRIQKITSIFGIQFNNYDKHKIIEYYDLFNNEDLTNERYGRTQSVKSHPKYEEIKSNYKMKEPKSYSDKITNKKLKKLMDIDIESLNQYLYDSNGIMIDIFFILFLIQTSIPAYPLNSKIDINLFDFENEPWNRIEQNIISKISMKTIDTVSILLKKMINLNLKNSFWIHIQELLLESAKYKELPSFNQQFLRVASFILKNAFIRDKLKEYYEFKLTNTKQIYVKDYWTTYKPLFDNKIVLSINQKTNEEFKEIQPFILRNGKEYLYENISSIRTFSDAQQNPRFKQLKIPFSEIMKNESYERLFNYAIHLHGRAPSIPIINLLIKRFIQTVSDKNIEGLLKKISWNPSFQKLKSIDYSDFQSFFVGDLTTYFKEKNPEDKDTINIYVHIHINNWNGMLLNGHPKRNYTYVPPTIFPDESYEELISVEEEGKEDEGDYTGRNFVNALFNRYCLDEDDEINERYSIDQFIYNIIPDPQIEKSIVCHKLLPKTKENFYKILDYKCNVSKLPLQDFSTKEQSIRRDLREYIRNNNLLERTADESYSILRNLYDIRDDTPSKEYRIIFNDMIKHNSFLVNRIQTFFTENEQIEQKQLTRFRSDFGRSVESLSVLINKLLDSSDKIPNLIKSKLAILSRLSNPITVKHGLYFHDHIPKQWKLSETNKTHYQEFINNNEFLFHYDIFTPQKKKTDDGFYYYQKERNHALCFQGLFNFVKPFYQEDIKENLFSEEYMDIFHQFNFLSLFDKLIDYIENLKDSDSIVSNQANILFSSLEDQERLERSDSIKLCTMLVFDLLIHSLEEYTDINWIYQSDNLSDKLSRQREREKQGIIDSLESKTADARLVTVHQQKCGLSNYFKSADQGNLTHIQSESYKTQTMDERTEFTRELFAENEVELEILEGMGIDTNHLQPSIPEEEEDKYLQTDQDREDEGGDDMDDDGDYKEN